MKKSLLTLIAFLFCLTSAWAQPSGSPFGPTPPDNTPYNATTWNNSWLAPTQNSVRDQIEAMLGGGVIDHGGLLGLLDDDHTQYFLANGSRDLSGTLTPSASNSFDLGTALDRFRDLYLSGNVTAPIYVAGIPAVQSGSYTINHGGIAIWWDVGNNTSVQFGPVADGTTTLGITGSLDISGALAGATLNTGQGAYELYAMNQDVESTDAVTFATVDTGQGANELYDMDQNVLTTSAVTFATVDTGQGANELYDMDQNVLTTSDVTFNQVTTATVKAPAASLILKPTTDAATAVQIADKDGNAILNVDTTNDRVGVGLVGPVTKLQVVGTNTNTVGAASGILSLGSLDGDNPYWGLRLDETYADLHFDTRYGGVNYSWVTIRRDTGNVGIGTTAPDKAIEINHATGGNLRLTYNDADGSAANKVDFDVSATGDLTIAPSGGDVAITGSITATIACCADYVFEPAYKLPTIDELETHVTEVGHLPGMTQGVGKADQPQINLAKAIQELIVKVEEQSLYIVQLHKRIKGLEGE